MSRTAGQPVVTVGQFFLVLRRRWLSLALALLIGALAGFAYYKHVPPSYQATAAVDITPPAGSGIDPKTVSTATEQKVVTSTQVATRAAAALSKTPDSVLKHVTVSSPLNSLVLDVSYVSSSAQAAADGANAFANAYISYRSDTGRSQLAQRAKSIQDRLTPLQQQLPTLPDPSERRSSVESQISSLQQQLAGIDLAPSGAGQLIGPAALPTAPNGPRLIIYGAAGIIFGLILGVAIAVVRERRDDSIHDAADVEDIVGEPVLAVVPQARIARRRAATLSTVSDPESAEADAIRLLALKLIAADPEPADASRARAFTLIGDDKTGMAPTNLAVTFARQGLRVALAGPTPALHRAAQLLHVQLTGRPGETMFPAPFHPLEGPGALHLLLLGDEVTLDRTLRSDLHQLSRLRQNVDVLVLDGANVAHESSALSLARHSDAAVLLARQGVTDCTHLRAIDRELGQIGARVAGAVLLADARRMPFRNTRTRIPTVGTPGPIATPPRLKNLTPGPVVDGERHTGPVQHADADVSHAAYGSQI